MRKGVAYMIDAFVGMMILVIFTLGTFSVTDSGSWDTFTDSVAAQDLSYTLKHTGHLEQFLSDGETGSLQTTIATVSERDFEVSGELRKTPYNLNIGFHIDKNQVYSTEIVEMSSGDRCNDEISTLQNESEVPILRTNNSGREAEHNTRAYLGNDPNYRPSAPPLSYDSLWLDIGNDCDFEKVKRPVRTGEIFVWEGTSPRHYIFEEVHLNTSSTSGDGKWNGRLEVHGVSQINRFQQTFKTDIAGVNTQVNVDSFNFSDSIENYDVVVFPGRDSLEAANKSANTETLQNYLEQNSVVFLSGVQESDFSDDSILSQLGFEWVDSSASGSTGTVEFSSSTHSKEVEDNFYGMKGFRDQVSLDPNGTLDSSNTDPVSSGKLVQYQDYIYDRLDDKVENTSMDPVSSEPDGAPETDCESQQPNGYMTIGKFDFPVEGGTEERTVLSTLVGNVGSSCVNRVINIDRDGDGDFLDSNEGPFLDREPVKVAGKPYRVNVVSGSEVSFLFQGNAKVEAVNFASFSGKKGKVVRANYESNYEEEDRKLIASTIYWLGEPYTIGETGEQQISTTVVGSLGEARKPYSLKLGWTR